MASISKEPNGRRTIQFVGADGRRRSVRLGKVSQRQAEAVKLRVEALNAAAISKTPMDGDTARWVAEVGDDLAEKLAKVGLIPARASATMSAFIDDYIAGRTDLKPHTRRGMEGARDRVVKYFGANVDLRSITPADADRWAVWLKENYAGATAGRTIGRARQFFKAAVRAKLLASNPFADVKAPPQRNAARLFFVTREMAAKLLDACPDAEWRLVIALARFGGLRTPSETLSLRLDDVDWERGRLRVISPKTEHIEGGGERWIPLFPELRQHLEAVFDAAPEGSVHFINRYRDATNTNLRTRLLKTIKRAGLTPWPRLFQNMRSSRETELAATHPVHVACAWIGNSALVAQKHYLQVTDADFAKAVQNPVQSAHATDCQQVTGSPQAPEKPGTSQPVTTPDDVSPCPETTCRGIEPLLAA